MRPRRSVSMPDGQNLRLWSDAELIALADRMQQGLDIRDRSGMLLHYLSKLLLAFFSHIFIKFLFSISLLCELMHGIPDIVQSTRSQTIKYSGTPALPLLISHLTASAPLKQLRCFLKWCTLAQYKN